MADVRAKCRCIHDSGDGECKLTRAVVPLREVVEHLRRGGRDIGCPGREFAHVRSASFPWKRG